jgi:DNA-binding NarL/FixJ family response regulator
MIVCVVDEMIFSVKILTAARALGVDIHFERRPEAVLDTVRALHPHLVILDLNSRKMQPMAAIAAIKADPSLADVKTLGYVSHVDADAVAAARAAGVDQVMARSAFSDRLGDVLTRRD